MTGTEPTPEPARRDVFVLAAGAVVAAGAALALWPFLDQMNPPAGSSAPDAVEIDLGPIRPGQMITVAWRGLPVFVRHRTAEEVAAARAVDVAGLPDTRARNAALPEAAVASDANRTTAGHEQWLVVVGVCTHMNCKLIESPGRDAADGAVGFVCPCHAARFDRSGRVVSGPARTNLTIPPYRFVGSGRLRIGAA